MDEDEISNFKNMNTDSQMDFKNLTDKERGRKMQIFGEAMKYFKAKSYVEALKLKKMECQNNNRPTEKTKEQILQAEYESLNFEEKIMRDWMEANPNMNLEQAIEFLEILP